jgi:hypothetical protein
MAFKQAKRQPVDGPVGVKRQPGGDVFIVNITHDGQHQTIVMSAYNAARVFATLGFMLASADGLGDSMVLLSKVAQREIKL